MFGGAIKNLTNEQNKIAYLVLAEVSLGQQYNSLWVNQVETVPELYDSVVENVTIFNTTWDQVWKVNADGDIDGIADEKDVAGARITIPFTKPNCTNIDVKCAPGRYGVSKLDQVKIRYLVNLEVKPSVFVAQGIVAPVMPLWKPAPLVFSYQWSFQTYYGWQNYTFTLNQQIEANYQRGVKYFPITVALITYDVNLHAMSKYRKRDGASFALKRTVF